MTCLAELQIESESEPRKPTLTDEEMLASRRLRYVVFSYDFFSMMMRQGCDGRFFRAVDPLLPKDAVALQFSEHCLFRSHQLAVKMWSSEWEPLGEADVIPEFEPMFTEVTVKERSQTYQYGGQL